MTIRVGTYYGAKTCSGRAELTTQLLQAFFETRFPETSNGGIYNCRNIAGTNTLSVHGTGRAFDLMTGTGRPTLVSQFLAEQMRLFSYELGIQGIIHNRLQWFCHKGTGWRPYTGSNPHVDHIHGERTVNMSLSATEIVRVLQGPSVTGGWQYKGLTVREGAAPDLVVRAQTRLNVHGFGLKVDGECGPKTTAAIRTFQLLAGIKVDGIAGPQTQGRLQ